MALDLIRSGLRLIYPPHCMTCNALVEDEGALCGTCWAETPFVSGLVCDKCGVPLPGEADEDGERLLCDDCMSTARPWARGRAALVYQGNARKVVLALKHGDRTDLAQSAGKWLARAAEPLITPETLIVPVPLHRLRLLRRRYNQSALLAQALAQETGCDICNDLLIRPRRTEPLDGKSKSERFETLAGGITLNSRYKGLFKGRHVLLVDDVMTSGATLAAATEALLASEVREVSTVTLTRVAKDA